MQTESFNLRDWPAALERARSLRLQPGCSAAFLWPVNVAPSLQDLHLLDADEQRRAQRFVQPVHRERFIAAHAGLRRLLAACTGALPESLQFERVGIHHKPRLQSATLRFNLSHSQDWAAVAIADGCEVGIDIEAVRPIEPELPQRYFSAQEQSALAQLSGAEWLEGCFRAWTRKEALLKAIGAGLALPLGEFTVSLATNAPAALLASALPELHVEDWSLVHLDRIPGYCGALAVPRGVERVAIFTVEDAAACR